MRALGHTRIRPSAAPANHESDSPNDTSIARDAHPTRSVIRTAAGTQRGILLPA